MKGMIAETMRAVLHSKIRATMIEVAKEVNISMEIPIKTEISEFIWWQSEDIKLGRNIDCLLILSCH